jgi:hypothetical protein
MDVSGAITPPFPPTNFAPRLTKRGLVEKEDAEEERKKRKPKDPEIYYKLSFIYEKAENTKFEWDIIRSFDDIKNLHRDVEFQLSSLRITLPKFPSARPFKALSNEEKLD